MNLETLPYMLMIGVFNVPLFIAFIARDYFATKERDKLYDWIDRLADRNWADNVVIEKRIKEFNEKKS